MGRAGFLALLLASCHGQAHPKIPKDERLEPQVTAPPPAYGNKIVRLDKSTKFRG